MPGFCICLIHLLLPAAASCAESSITVQTDVPGISASSNLYGIFVEDWCHQVEGGIYAEMIRNRNFDDTKSAKEVLVAGFVMRIQESEKVESGKPLEVPGWKLVTGNPKGGEWAIDESRPLNGNNPRSLRLTFNDVSGGTGVYNEGHCNNVQGIAVTKGGEYRFSCFARSDSPGAGLTASIQAPDGRIIASEPIRSLSKDWRKYELALVSSESMTGARLFIAPNKAGTYFLDMVSLFPKYTWKDRSNGLRKDLMEMVAALKPSFVRFPGGCFVEGLELENAWHWKDTLGPVEERPGHWNIWGWRYSGGMGYFEYLQMCEDLGAEPLHVINDGISHLTKDGVQQDGVYRYQPMEKMDVLVQDALDSIEYANGPVDSIWGAKRAAAGHPQPFNLRYIEVGNENFGPEYAERSSMFHDAIKSKYPQITVIMDTWGPKNFPKNRVPDMLDIHRFTTPHQFALNYSQFDDYDRKGPKVYFGEWCVELELPNKESLESGLYEGVFLTGLEKNSDHVRMMSYAPFMNNLGWQNRKPNMLGFDLDHVYGAPIYWLQKMYSENRIETLLKFTVNSPEYKPARLGTIGVGTQDTEAEFKDILVTDSSGVIFNGNTASAGEWNQEGKKAKSPGSANRGLITLGGEGGVAFLTKAEFKSDHTISMKARKLSGKNGFLVYFNTYFNSKNFWQIGGDGNKSSKIVGEGFSAQEIKKLTLEDNRWYDLKIEVRGDAINCSIDGILVSQTCYKPLQSLYVSAGRKDSTGEIVFKVINPSPTAQLTRLRMPAANLESSGEATVLTSNNPNDKNSLEKPNHVVPKTAVVRDITPDFQYEFPAYSATVLKLKEKKPR